MPYFNYDSHRMFYREQGAGELLLILPGNTASSVWHEGELSHFSDRYHVGAIDVLGTGQSDRIKHWPTDWWLESARQGKALVDHLNTSRCIVMGCSGGAVAALLMAIHFPETVSAVIADSGAERFDPALLRQEADFREHRPAELVEFWKHAHGADWAAVVDADSRILRMKADSGGEAFDGQLGEIHCPVLLTASMMDEAIPDAAWQNASMGKQIKNSCVFMANAGSHPFMWTQSEVFRAAADQFLRTLPTTR